MYLIERLLNEIDLEREYLLLLEMEELQEKYKNKRKYDELLKSIRPPIRPT